MAQAHPGSITVVDVPHRLSRVISAFDLPLEERFAPGAHGEQVPVATILELGDGRVAAFDAERRLIRVVERDSALRPRCRG